MIGRNAYARSRISSCSAKLEIGRHARKERLDAALVERQLVESRQKAQALILAGKVMVDGQKAGKPGHIVAPEARLEVEQPLKYVSRAGLKLETALSHFQIDVNGKMCLDVGTSTGGFTDCLLQHGSSARACGRHRRGTDPLETADRARVVLHERMNARYLTFQEIGELVDLIACDVSFISVTLLIPALSSLLAPQGDWIILVKPQFEVGRESGWQRRYRAGFRCSSHGLR